MENLILASDVGSLGPVAIATAAAIFLGMYLRGSVKGTDADRLWAENRATIARLTEENTTLHARGEVQEAEIDKLKAEIQNLRWKDWVCQMNHKRGE